jgi:AcrR family transcriptional regulator
MKGEYDEAVDDVKPPRDRRARRAAETRLRIIEAAGKRFAERGYSGTTIDAVAADADVAVETVYARFKNKRNLLAAYLDVAIVGDADNVPLLERDEVQQIRHTSDQHEQLRGFAHLARTIYERTATAHAVLRSAAAVDPDAATLADEDDRRRRTTIRAYIDIVADAGPLRDGLSAEEAADTFSVLASPEGYLRLTTTRGWTPAHYEQWLAENLTLLLLPPS